MIDSKVPYVPSCGLNILLGILGAVVAIGIDSPSSRYSNMAFSIAIAVSSILGALISMYEPPLPCHPRKTRLALYCEICAILITASIGILVLFKLPGWM